MIIVTQRFQGKGSLSKAKYLLQLIPLWGEGVMMME